MTRKKQSRVPSRARPKKLDITIDNIDDEDKQERQENLRKRLEDFDQQVKSIVAQMEEDKEATLASIKQLYFRDEQLCAKDTNELSWIDFMKKNIPVPHARQSINALISLAESQPATAKRKRQKRVIPFANIPSFNDTPQVVTETKTRGRPKRNALTSSQADNLQVPPRTSTRSSSRVRKCDLSATPLNSGVLPPLGNFVTPKFDPRTPLHHMSSLRTPRVGEIAMSMKGSPLQVGPKELLASLMEDDLDTQTKEELKEFHEKLGRLLI